MYQERIKAQQYFTHKMESSLKANVKLHNFCPNASQESDNHTIAFKPTLGYLLTKEP